MVALKRKIIIAVVQHREPKIVSKMGMDLGFLPINKMNHQHEREGIVTLTEHNIMPVDAFRIAEEYRVGTNRWDNG